MNPAENHSVCSAKIDTSCRLPLLVLFNGAALWLILGLAFSLFASLTFHNPEKFSSNPFMTYGHAVAIANNLLVYGFAIPAGLGVMLWIFARLSQAELVLPLVPFVAAHLWHLGVLAGVVAILAGESTGYLWLEFPRAAAALMGVSFVLIAISAVATFGQRQERELYPSHWFLLAALLWFPWIYSTGNLFLVTTHPVRGVAQSVINWWFANNLIFVWLSLVGIGVAFYFLPKIANRPLHSRFYALFAFWTLILFGSWLGIPAGAPVPAWLPTASKLAAMLLVIPLLAVAVIIARTAIGASVPCKGGTFCYVKFGTFMFLFSGLLIAVTSCPKVSGVMEFTWLGQAQVQLQILGFAAMTLLGAIYDILPRIMGTSLPYKKFAAWQFYLSALGVALLVIPLAVAGVKQGHAGYDPAAARFWLQMSTGGTALLLLGSLFLALNSFVMTLKWKLGLAVTVYSAITAPLKSTSASDSLRRDQGEVKS